MTLAIVHSRASCGIEAPPVAVEVHVSNGLPKYTIVGLPEAAVKESKDRVRSAVLNCHFDFWSRRLTVNLAPADLPKEGGRFDLPIALGVLAATNQIPKETLADYEFIGELALSGELRPIRGALPFALAARQAGKTLVVPKANAAEAALPSDVVVLPATHLLEVTEHLLGVRRLTPYAASSQARQIEAGPDLADVRGQHHARRSLEIAASGCHSILFSGPPGTGKTMLASRLPGIMPELAEEQALEVAAVHSICGKTFDPKVWRIRPFRAPHHTASSVALVGGGSPPKPGEISLAHQGVLFLDELPEYQRNVLEALREPLESGHVTISRASYQAQFPAKFQLVAAMNPCPCGYLGDESSRCHCTPDQIRRYTNKLSGPLLDRIDLHVEVPRLPLGALSTTNATPQEDSATVRTRASQAWMRQLKRAGKANANMTHQDIGQHCQLSSDTQTFFDHALEKLGLSARAYHRVLKVARTIADLAESEKIEQRHIAEALSYQRRPVRG